MAVLPAAASAAYRAAAGISASPTPGIAPANIGGDFSDFLSSAIKDSVGTIKQGEQMATQSLSSGGGNIVDVVNAVNAAEMSLDTVVAVRDKVVQAYQSIMNMPI